MANNQKRGPQAVGFLPSYSFAGTGNATLTLNSATAWLTMGFQSDLAKTLARVRVFCTNVTGTPAPQVDVYSDVGGVPTTILATSTTTSPSPIAAGWVDFGGASTGLNLAITAGVQYWAVLKNLAGSPASNRYTLGFGVPGTMPIQPGGGIATQGWNRLVTSGSFGTPQLGVAGMRLEYTDGTYDGFPISDISTSANLVYDANEAGVRFTVPPGATWNVRGAVMWSGKTGSPTGNLRFKLHTGSTPSLQATSLDILPGTVAANGPYTAYFPSTVALSPGTVVTLAASNSAADDGSNCYRSPALYTFDTSAGALKPLLDTLQSAVSTDSGASFALTATKFTPFGLLLDTDGPFAAGGGGGNTYSRGRVVNA